MYIGRNGNPTADIQDAIDLPIPTREQINARIKRFDLAERMEVSKRAFEEFDPFCDEQEFAAWEAFYQEKAEEVARELLDQEFVDSMRR
ncbi:MAG TPA: hypothetical protein VFM46_02690 [Pseudomonadales bacterium]|nr:hypothetical protein [Pseudomonadales bacterium]